MLEADASAIEPGVYELSTRFGRLTVPARLGWRCEPPLPGFDGLHQYLVLSCEGQEPFLWLQSVESTELAFLIAPAEAFGLRYRGGIDAEESGMPGPSVLVILPRPGGSDSIGCHRWAPLMFDPSTRSFHQRVFEPDEVEGAGIWCGLSPQRQSELRRAWAGALLDVPSRISGQ